jgi:ATP synthase protein I
MDSKHKNNPDFFAKQIGEKENRKLNAQKNERSIWSGLGMFGIVGWSIVIPALAGAALGIWLDKKIPQAHSWTVTFLLIGLIGGCLLAWKWIDKENKEMHKDKNKKNG